MRTGGNFAQLGVAGGEERKYDDVTLSTAMTTTGTFVLMNGLVPGSLASQRIGSKCDFVSILCRFRINTGATPTNCAYRIMVIVDKQANGVAPTVAEVLVGAALVTSPQNLDNRARFVVLLDYVDTLDIQSHSINMKTVFMRKKISTTYNSGVAGTVGDIRTNSVYLLLSSTEAAGATAPVLSLYTRMRFTDG